MTVGVGNPSVFIQGTGWAIENIIETPVDSVTNDPAFAYMNVFSMIFRVVIQVERLFVKKKKNRKSRKVGEDQLTIFKSLERSLQNTGLNGRACLMRTICELQQTPLNHYSIMGEILMALLSPKRSSDNLMFDYLEAEKLGQEDPQSCASVFSQCPFSVIKMMRTYSTPADKPNQHSKGNHDNKEGKSHDVDGPGDFDPSIQLQALTVDML